MALMGETPLLGTLWLLVVAVVQVIPAVPDNLGDQEAVLLAHLSGQIVVLLVELGLQGKDILAGLLITFVLSFEVLAAPMLAAKKVEAVVQAALAGCPAVQVE
jgi:hypothetical protein